MKYWIVGSLENKSILENMGITLPKYSKKYGQWENVTLTSEQLTELDNHWGTFFWGKAGQLLEDVQKSK